MIGLFDSGVGGLSVLKAITQSGINENFIYFGDTKNVPYGTKTKEQILAYTKDIMEFFIKKGAGAAIMACNTSSALVYEELSALYGDKIKIFPLIQKSAPYFANESGITGVMATKATVKSGAYSKEITKINSGAKVFELECQDFVRIVENRLYDDKEALKYIEEKINILKKAGCKSVILGCTHFPYLVPAFKKFAPEMKFLDPAKFLIQAVKEEIKTEKPAATFEFYVSSAPENFQKSGSLFFNIEEKVQLVEFAKV